MSSQIISAIKRLFVKHGNARTILKTTFLIISLFVLFMVATDEEGKYTRSFGIDFSNDYDINEFEETSNKVVYYDPSSINSNCDSIGLCSEKTQSKRDKTKKRWNPKVWKSKFKGTRDRVQQQPPRGTIELPQRVLELKNSVKPIKSIYKEDEILENNRTWTMKNHIERRKIFLKRKREVTHQCQKRENGYLQSLANCWDGMRWSRQYHILWCPVFKAASTTWMKYFLLMGDEKEVIGSLHARVRELYQAPKGRHLRNDVSKKSLKLLIVRHPFERLLSAYRDKMLRVLNKDDVYKEKQLQIMLEYGECTLQNYNATNPQACYRQVSNTSVLRKNNIRNETTKNYQNVEFEDLFLEILDDVKVKHPTFLQFLLFIREDLINFIVKRRTGTIDSHWMPISVSCAPCMFQYDVIAHVETLTEDQEYIIHEAGLEKILQNSHTHASRFDNFADTQSAVKKYFNEIPVSLLKELRHLYRADFSLFGYSPDFYYNIAQNDK